MSTEARKLERYKLSAFPSDKLREECCIFIVRDLRGVLCSLSEKPRKQGRAAVSRFIAFDVETPNRRSDRMSAVGITVIEDGIIEDGYYSLVNPETHFDYFNTQITGISEETVRNAPVFPEVWTQIEPLMSSGLLVAHNAVFDMGVLKKCLYDYGIEWKPYVRYICTVQMGRRILPGMSHKLNALCEYYGICLDHHKADSDSRACADILLRYLDGGADIKQFIRICSLNKNK